MDIIYVRGGDKSAPDIARKAGMHYGTRHDYKPYAGVYMLDINWKKYEWRQYMSLIRQYQPVMALAPDYEHSWQYTALRRQIDDLRPLVKYVQVCPKFHGAVQHIPLDCVVAVSVPAPTYAGFVPDLRLLTGRKIHLLGGNPFTQRDYIMKLNGVNAEVVSVDGNTIGMKAGKGQCFSEGVWKQQRDRRSTDDELCETSAINYARFLQSVKHERWQMFPALRILVNAATVEDIDAIQRIARQYPKELGYVRIPALKESIGRGNLIVARDCGQIVGFVNYRACRDGWSTVYEIAVDKARRGEQIGAGLLAAVPEPIRLKCTTENPANAFYEGQGFTCVATEPGKKRALNVWHKGAMRLIDRRNSGGLILRRGGGI